ncbi:hypothetical protein OF83DRAFT_1088754, partial [Amylostereum chailletii]
RALGQEEETEEYHGESTVMVGASAIIRHQVIVCFCQPQRRVTGTFLLSEGITVLLVWPGSSPSRHTFQYLPLINNPHIRLHTKRLGPVDCSQLTRWISAWDPDFVRAYGPVKICRVRLKEVMPLRYMAEPLESQLGLLDAIAPGDYGIFTGSHVLLVLAKQLVTDVDDGNRDYSGVYDDSSSISAHCRQTTTRRRDQTVGFGGRRICSGRG